MVIVCGEFPRGGASSLEKVALFYGITFALYAVEIVRHFRVPSFRGEVLDEQGSMTGVEFFHVMLLAMADSPDLIIFILLVVGIWLYSVR